jgi:hypothetical protein
MSLAETCEAEIRDLHAFFVDWFTGERPRTSEELARLENALGAGFQLLGPDGDVASRSGIIDAVEDRHGAAQSDEAPDRIDIEAVEPRFERDDVCLLTYEEHQRTAGTWHGRRSSALFERAPDTPGGVVWRHFHETWLDG